jgi:hypothetical protein
MSRSTLQFETVFYRMAPQLALAAAFAMLLSLLALTAKAQQANDGGQDKHLDIRSSAGDLHVAMTPTSATPDYPSIPPPASSTTMTARIARTSELPPPHSA